MNQDFLVMSRKGRVFDWTEVGVMQYESVIDISYLIYIVFNSYSVTEI